MTESPRHSVSVAAAIFDESGENVLLIKRRDNGKWEPPGGVLELEETIEEGLRREVREETGAEIEIGPLTGVYKNMARGIVALVFACRVKSVVLSRTAEATEISWIPMADIGALMDEAFAVRVTDAQGADAAGPAIRTHNGERLLGPIGQESRLGE